MVVLILPCLIVRCDVQRLLSVKYLRVYPQMRGNDSTYNIMSFDHPEISLNDGIAAFTTPDLPLSLAGSSWSFYDAG